MKKSNKEQTLYELLGVSETATLEEIKIAYRKKAMEYHPDVNPSLNNIECHVMMCKINDAYAVLRNPETRREYDKTLVQNREESEPRETSDSAQEKKEKTKKYTKTKSEPLRDERVYEYYNSVDFDGYLQEEFIIWLEEYAVSYILIVEKYYKKININEEVLLNNLYKSFDNIISYEKYMFNNKYNKRSRGLSK